jgi:hypothetical protein
MSLRAETVTCGKPSLYKAVTEQVGYLGFHFNKISLRGFVQLTVTFFFHSQVTRFQNNTVLQRKAILEAEIAIVEDGEGEDFEQEEVGVVVVVTVVTTVVATMAVGEIMLVVLPEVGVDKIR